MATPQEFTQRWWCDALRVSNQTGFFPELVLATWAIDTGWGQATGMLDCHALLGIVCFDPGRYPCTLCNPELCFYCFPSWQAFFATFIEVLQMRLYDVVRAQSTPEGQADALANQTGFAGAPPNPEYYQKLLAAMATIRSFNPSCNPPPPPPPPPPAPGIAMLLLGGLLLYAGIEIFRRERSAT